MIYRSRRRMEGGTPMRHRGTTERTLPVSSTVDPPERKLRKSSNNFNKRRHGVCFETPPLLCPNLSDDAPTEPIITAVNNHGHGEGITEVPRIIAFVVDIDDDLAVRFRTCNPESNLISYGDTPDFTVPEFDDDFESVLSYDCEDENMTDQAGAFIDVLR
jgi:hypothetical protein